MEGSKGIFMLCLGACGLAFSQTESRSDLIESARTQKEAYLTPEIAPKGTPERSHREQCPL